MLVDSHCHLDGAAFDADRGEVIARAREAGVGFMLAIGTGDGPPDLACAARLAEQYDGVAASAGVHPHDAARFAQPEADALAKLRRHPKVVGVGEIGLDYHYDNSPREAQRRAFVTQMEIAAEHGMPIIIHTRDAWDDTLALLDEHWRATGLGGVMHCFSGSSEQAARCLDMGFHISFAGILTFARAQELRDTARWIPRDRLLVETDSPYLTPEPHRKIRRNEPRFVVETARKLAQVAGCGLEEIAERTTANFDRLFPGARGRPAVADSRFGSAGRLD